MKYQDFIAASLRAKERQLNESRDYTELLNEEILNPTVLNEKGYGGGGGDSDFSDYFDSLFSYVKLMAQYPRIVERIAQQRHDAAIGAAKLKVETDAKKEQVKEKVKAALDAQLDRITDRDKKAKLREQFDQKEKAMIQQITLKLSNKEKEYKMRTDAAAAKLAAEKTRLENDNDITDDYLNTSWEEAAADIDLESAVKWLHKTGDAVEQILSEISTTEQMEARRKKDDEKEADLKAKHAEKMKKLDAEAKVAAQKFKEAQQNAAPEVKETLNTLRAIQIGFRQYILAGQRVQTLLNESTDLECILKSIRNTKIEINESGEFVENLNWAVNEADSKELRAAKEEKAKIRKQINAAIDTLSKTKIAKATGKTDKEAEDFLNGINDQWTEIQAQFKAESDDTNDVNVDDEIRAVTGDTEDDKPAPAKPEPTASKGPSAENTTATTDKDAANQTTTTQTDDNLSAEDKAEKAELESDIKKAEAKIKEFEDAGYEQSTIDKIRATIEDKKKKLAKIEDKAKSNSEFSSVTNFQYELMTLRLRLAQDMMDLGIII